MGRDLHLPDGAAAAMAAAVVLHPHPAMGGDRHHPLVVAVAEGLAGVGIAALRIDLADPDPTVSAAALETVASELLADTATDRLVLVGYSWGAVVALLAEPSGLVARALVAPPVSWFAPDGPDQDRGATTPTLVLAPAHDRFGPPDAVRAALGGRPGTEIEEVAGADHFLAGAIARIAGRVVAWTGQQLRVRERR